MLASGTQDRGFTPGRGRRIFRAKKILSIPFFESEIKTVCPCRRFAACQRTLKITLEITNFRLKYLTFLARFRSSLTDVFGVAWHIAPMEMTDGTKWPRTKGLLA
jgi:hypothetical protein